MRTQAPARAAIAALLVTFLLATPAVAQDHTFALEVNDVLCGYVEMKASEAETDGKKIVVLSGLAEKDKVLTVAP